MVFGDIGTSPLYAFRECFRGPHGVSPSSANVVGVLSLMLWALVIVVSIKYVLVILRADNRGEGGILALLVLTGVDRRGKGRGVRALAAAGVFGAALLYGDGAITPAISVLSAVEGLEIATAVFHPWVIPITLGILVGLFAIQHRGTATIGRAFGPISLLWFGTLAVIGGRSIVAEPRVLAAVNPLRGAAFLAEHGAPAFLVLGTVFLVVTGGEALYADLGHFGRRPIRLGWFGVVLPALLLNYFGQGALLLRQPGAAESPFYLLVPDGALLPLVALATAATIIASQAVISGCFSLTRQAVQLGYLPRLRIAHTSAEEAGQVYVGAANWVLMLATILLVLGFRSSSRLAAAYGVAVATTMVITTILLAVVARTRWRWSVPTTMLVAGGFLAVDCTFMGANLGKLDDGGWLPLAIAGAVFAVMATWKDGRQRVFRKLGARTMALGQLLADVAAHPPARVAGVAVFMAAHPTGVPTALLHNLKHNKVLHEHVILLTVATEDQPYVPVAARAEVEILTQGFSRIRLRYGFMEIPNVPYALERVVPSDVGFHLMRTTFFLGRESLVVDPRSSILGRVRTHLFALLARTADPPTTFYRIPPNLVVEFGVQIEL